MKKNNDELNRFKLLLEYDFYVGEEDNVDLLSKNPDSEILTEEPPEVESDDLSDDADSELPDDTGNELPDDISDEEPEPVSDDEFPDSEEPMEDDLPEPEPMEDDLPEPEPMEDEVELDVTELVQGTEEAKAASDKASQQIDILMNKFDALSNSLNKMNMINQKIDDLEHEFEKRNPLPKEKLEMQSLNSYPYSLKLTDYWSEKEGKYDVMNNEKEEEEELVLTQDEVNTDYNPIAIKDSFSDPEEESGRFKY